MQSVEHVLFCRYCALFRVILLRPGRMRCRMDLLQLVDRQVGVDLRSREHGMAQDLLDKVDVRTVLQHQRRHGVTEQMAGTFLVDIGLLHVLFDRATDLMRIQRLARLIQEHSIGTRW